jgi:hypothetical protein
MRKWEAHGGSFMADQSLKAPATLLTTKPLEAFRILKGSHPAALLHSLFAQMGSPW